MKFADSIESLGLVNWFVCSIWILDGCDNFQNKQSLTPNIALTRSWAILIPVCLACQLFFDWHTWPPVDNQVEHRSSVLMNPCFKNPTTMIGEELRMSWRIPCRLAYKTLAVPRMRFHLWLGDVFRVLMLQRCQYIILSFDARDVFSFSPRGLFQVPC